MAGLVLEFRDEEQYGELMSKMHKAKKAVCEAFEAMEEADGGISERNGSYRSNYRSGNYRSGGGYRGNYRNEDMVEDPMDLREGGRYRY